MNKKESAEKIVANEGHCYDVVECVNCFAYRGEGNKAICESMYDNELVASAKEYLESLEQEAKTDVCEWWLDSLEYNDYNTQCNNIFSLIDATPEENGMKYCCYCGKIIEEKRHEEY